MLKALLTTVLLVFPGLLSAQTDYSTRNPVGLFQDLQADTVTTDLFNHFAPTPHIAFHVTDPVPGQDVIAVTEGLAAVDFDNDGDQDVVVGVLGFAGESGARLLVNNGDGTFAVSQNPGLPRGLYHVVAGDLDNDGWTDLVGLALTGGFRPRVWESEEVMKRERERAEPRVIHLVVLHNDQGRGFQTSLDLTEDRSHLNWTDPLVADFDQDGWLDVLWVASRENSTGVATRFRGGPAGFSAGEPENLTWTGLRMFSLLDLDADGDPDLLNQGGLILSPPTPGLLNWWSNEQGVFVPRGEAPLPQISRPSGLFPADVNNDGLIDLFAGCYDFGGGANQLYLNLGDGRYRDQGKEMGLWAGYNNTTSVAWADWDNDTFVDMLQSREFNEGRYTESALFLNEGGRRFLNVTARADQPLGPSSYGGLALDADRDGDLDLMVGHISHFFSLVPLEDCRLQLLRNDSQTDNWLEVRLEGTVSNRSAIGGQAAVHLGPVTLTRLVGGGTSTWGRTQPPLPMHFGLGDAAVADSVTVRWPGGRSEVFAGGPGNRQIVLVEGQGRSRP